MTTKFVAIPGRVVHRVSIESVPALDEFVAGADQLLAPNGSLPDEIAQPIVHITYQTTVPDVRARLIAAIKGRGHFFPVPLAPERVRPRARRPR